MQWNILFRDSYLSLQSSQTANKTGILGIQIWWFLHAHASCSNVRVTPDVALKSSLEVVTALFVCSLQTIYLLGVLNGRLELSSFIHVVISFDNIRMLLVVSLVMNNSVKQYRELISGNQR